MGAINTPLDTPRATLWAGLEGSSWDLVVVGGGISGAGVAQQAAAQGWRVLLVEQRDFAWGTSSRSSKLVHGGLRYLKEGDIQTTLHSVWERERLLREAPELVQPQTFLHADVPGRSPPRWLMQLGLAVYGLMAGKRSHRYAPLAEVQALEPGLNLPGLRGALLFQDAKTDDARLVQRVLMQAQALGATCLNYVAAQRVLRDERGKQSGGQSGVHGGVQGVLLCDQESGQSCTVHTRAVVNATGAWADRLRLDGGARPLLRPLRGSHLLVPHRRLPVQHSISLSHPRDGRPVFFYPWEGCTLIGTTDLDHRGDLNLEACITQDEVDYLLQAVNDQFRNAHLSEADVCSSYAGVRPVLDDGQAQASKATRDHLACDEGGLITLTGGKLTTFRRMAHDALRLVGPRLGRPYRVDDAPVFSPAKTAPGWDAATAQRLAARYGAWAADWVGGADAQLLQCVPGTPTRWVELVVAARHEAVCHLDDLLLRRTRLGLQLPDGALAHTERIRALVQAELGWSDARWAQELQRYQGIVQACYSLPRHARPSTHPKPSPSPSGTSDTLTPSSTSGASSLSRSSPSPLPEPAP
ncbi:MAG: glycerol-3-phosphate dehydrogenase/oxidase [Rhodoferax sp.]